MAEGFKPAQRSEPSLTAVRHWKNYLLGMATETLFVLALTAVGFGLAVLAKVMWP